MNFEESQVAVIGTGEMGLRVARRLLSAGFAVKAWNRTPQKAEVLRDDGAQVCATAADAIRDTDFVVINLFDGNAVNEVLFAENAAAAAKPGTVVIDMSSIEPQMARDFHTRLARREVGYIDAPVTGGVIGAEAGTMLIMAGGRESDIEKASEIFDLLGRLMIIGESGAGQFAKMANQLLMAATAGALAEALLLAERANVDPERILDSVRGGLVHSRALELYGRRMLARDFRSRGANAAMQVKDLESALAQAKATQLEIPLTSVLCRLFHIVVRDCGDVDKSAIWLPVANGTAGEL